MTDRACRNVTIVIRSIGERTEYLCRELVLAQGIRPEHVRTVNEAPFSNAMRKSFRLGIESGLTWTLCIDADVLLRPGAVEELLDLAEQQPDNVCEVQGYVLDKFVGGPWHAGNHLYRTSLLPQVLSCIPEEGTAVQPEYHTLKAMKAAGYPYKIAPYLLGLHDFQQYYRDIFRKCFIHARKHEYLVDLYLSFWRDKVATDPDYNVALQGLGRGLAYCNEVRIDIRQDIYREAFAALGIEEKEPLSPTAYTLDEVEKLIDGWQKPAAYNRHYPTEMGLNVPPEPNPVPFRMRITQRVRDLGLPRTALYSLGWALNHAGRALQKRADR